MIVIETHEGECLSADGDGALVSTQGGDKARPHKALTASSDESRAY
jgi:hypothetical protein